MATTATTSGYMYDVSDRHEVAKFPEDFADWLMMEGREQDAREYLVRVQHLEEGTEAEDLTLDAVIEIAEEYAPIFEFNNEMGRTPEHDYSTAYPLLRLLDEVDEPTSGDKPLSWDREAALVNQALADMPTTPVDMDEHEFPDVTIYVVKGDTILDLLVKAMLTLAKEGYVRGAKNFAQDLLYLTRRPVTDIELFELVWSYVDVMSEFERDRQSHKGRF